jgi:hypothetical protein
MFAMPIFAKLIWNIYPYMAEMSFETRDLPLPLPGGYDYEIMGPTQKHLS